MNEQAIPESALITYCWSCNTAQAGMPNEKWDAVHITHRYQVISIDRPSVIAGLNKISNE